MNLSCKTSSCTLVQRTHVSPQLRKQFVRRPSKFSKSFVVSLPCRSDITLETATTDWGSLNTMGMFGSQAPNGPLNCQSQGGCGYHNGQWSQNSNWSSLTWRELDLWLLVGGVPRSEIDRQSTKFWLDRYTRMSCSSNEPKSDSHPQPGVMAPQSIPRLEPDYRLKTLNEGLVLNRIVFAYKWPKGHLSTRKKNLLATRMRIKTFWADGQALYCRWDGNSGLPGLIEWRLECSWCWKKPLSTLNSE